MGRYQKVTIRVPLFHPFTSRYRLTPTEAWMVGRYLAVHRGRDGVGWSVIHTPTRRALDIDLVSKAAAYRLANRVTHLNWNFRVVTGRVAKATLRRAKPLVCGLN